MHPFSIPRVGELYLRSMSRFAPTQLFSLQGIGAVDKAEIGAYYDLLKREDGHREHPVGITEGPFGTDGAADTVDRQMATIDAKGIDSRAAPSCEPRP